MINEYCISRGYVREVERSLSVGMRRQLAGESRSSARSKQASCKWCLALHSCLGLLYL